MLPALKIAYENYVTEQKCGSTKDKLRGLLKKMKDAEIICRIATAFDIFEVMQPLSLVFEGEGLMAFNIKPTVDMISNAIRPSPSKTSDNGCITSKISKAVAIRQYLGNILELANDKCHWPAPRYF